MFVPSLLSSAIGLVGIVSMAIEQQVDSCKRFHVFEVPRRTKLNVTFAIERCGNGELKDMNVQKIDTVINKTFCRVGQKILLSSIDLYYHCE